jgi:hypothetical protein
MGHTGFKDFSFPKLQTIHMSACAYAIYRMVGQFFVTTAFQLCFRICQMTDAKKSEQNEKHGIQRFVVYIDHVNSGDDNTSTTKVQFLFWKCENFILNFYSDSSHCVILYSIQMRHYSHIQYLNICHQMENVSV